ncbi:hypothetical protein GRJ2_001704000 [Grus japonensis]|uniref:Uncharacterized protein n=1 Tax=Grus japonensis TaxID=30415 RepID=A0ABC9X6M0_GRUJA
MVAEPVSSMTFISSRESGENVSLLLSSSEDTDEELPGMQKHDRASLYPVLSIARPQQTPATESTGTKRRPAPEGARQPGKTDLGLSLLLRNVPTSWDNLYNKAHTLGKTNGSSYSSRQQAALLM